MFYNGVVYLINTLCILGKSCIRYSAHGKPYGAVGVSWIALIGAIPCRVYCRPGSDSPKGAARCG